MTSYYCQICRMDMSTARIRTPEEPPDAAWDYKGCSYIGFAQFRNFVGEPFPDRQCRQCNTVDRTPANFYEDARNIVFCGPLWAEENDNDIEWLPENNSDANSDPLEYNSGAESESDSWNSGVAESDNGNNAEDEDEDVSIYDALREIYAPPQAMSLPHGTWLNGYVYSRDFGRELLHNLVQHTTLGSFIYPAGHTAVVMPVEHIAAPSCQSLQGINGHMLSVEEMKNCRTHRFLLAKPPQWRTEVTDNIFENESLFVLSGEANGSHTSHSLPVHPPRYSVDNVKLWSVYANDGCNESDSWMPLPVHSYCLDVYAKASYRRLGRVDLDGIWHWREMLSCPESYFLTEADLLPCPEILRGRKSDNDPWCHHAGDEWLAANPVEVPGLREMVERCSTPAIRKPEAQQLKGYFLKLPTEIVCCIISFLDESDLNSIANVCRTFRHLSQPSFKALTFENLGFLWEIVEGVQYPNSPDQSPTWDPRFPHGLVPPELPIGLGTEEDEQAVWALITNDDPDMRSVGEAIKTLNFLRREAIVGPSRTATEWSIREWQSFRAQVADWICCLPSRGTERTEEMDWVRLWRLFNPNTTKISGIRNRARIWIDCQKILDCNNRLRDQGEMDTKQENVREVLSYNRVQWWETASTAMELHQDET